MNRYRKVELRLWSETTFRTLSPIKPSGQSLYLYLFTGPHTGRIPGLFSVGRRGLIESLGWSTKAFNLAFAELESSDLAQADWGNRLVFLPRILPMDVPMKCDSIKKWREEWEFLPSCPLKTTAFNSFSQFFEAYSGAYLAVFNEITGHLPLIDRDRTGTGTGEREGRREETEAPSGPVSLSASQDSFFQITEERWQKATQAGFTDRAWVERETKKFVLEYGKSIPGYKDPDSAWLKWLYRGKEYAERHPNVVPIKPVEAPRRRHLFGER